MAAAFMERRARLRNSLLFLLFIIAGCTSSVKKDQQPQVIPNVLVNRIDTGLSNANGTLLLHAQSFSGTLFTLYEGTTDTAELASYLNGKEHGLWVKYYPSGTVKEKRSFDNGKKSGDYMAWW